MLIPMTDLRTWAQQVASWRREVHGLYAAVRAAPDPETGHGLWVEGRTELFDRHPASARQPGQRLRHAAYDPAYRFVVDLDDADPEEWRPATGQRRERCPSSGSGASNSPSLGGLDVWWLGSYGNGIFLPLRDATAGRTTYGAGRYLLDTVKGADLGRDGDSWVLDLNFSYSPSCAYDPAWACPLAPAGNRLEVEVPVGERTPTAD